MTKAAISSSKSGHSTQTVVGYILLAVCLCVIALRATYAEGPPGRSTDQSVNLSDNLYSLSLSAALAAVFLVWFVWAYWSKGFLCSPGWLEIGFLLFTVAAIVSGFFAADKRAAINSYVTLGAPALMAMALIRILDSRLKIRLVLTVVAALGVVSAYQCAEQFFFTNQMMIEQYQKAPETLLGPLGIVPGTFGHMLFEHRLFSRGVHGFFTTSNSAGSFALLASFAAVALFMNEFINRKKDPSGPARVVTAGAAAAIVIFGLLLTASKGAIGAAVIAAVMFVAYLLAGDWLRAHKKFVLIGCILLFLAGVSAVVAYGLICDELPGGNSMLVRWQYWCASVRMFGEHPLTGVGPGNFACYYPRYKAASALETVSDPHNFLLSVLTQYGPLGLAGLLVMILSGLWRAVFSSGAVSDGQNASRNGRFGIVSVIFAVVISAALLFIRPLLMKVPAGTLPAERQAAAIMLYFMPVFVFVVGFILAGSGRISTDGSGNDITIAALFCGAVGVLIHNLIDFAIFEPGLLTAFWVIMACVISLKRRQEGRAQFAAGRAPYKKVIVLAGGAVLIWAYLNYALIPVAGSTAKIRQAYLAATNGRFEQADELLAAAAEDDRLSPLASSIRARLYLQRFEAGAKGDTALLQKARDRLLEAAERGRADYKNFERLAEVYGLLAESSAGERKTDYLHQAFDAASGAVELYPGSGRLRFQLAGIAERSGDADYACRQYQKAVEIEESYRRQFERMYPGRAIVSRIGQEKYSKAKERIKQLCRE